MSSERKTSALSDDDLREAVVKCLEIARDALDHLPAERKAADQVRNVVGRNYRLGLLDGMDEAIGHILRPLYDAVCNTPSGGAA